MHVCIITATDRRARVCMCVHKYNSCLFIIIKYRLRAIIYRTCFWSNDRPDRSTRPDRQIGDRDPLNKRPGSLMKVRSIIIKIKINFLFLSLSVFLCVYKIYIIYYYIGIHTVPLGPSESKPHVFAVVRRLIIPIGTYIILYIVYYILQVYNV